MEARIIGPPQAAGPVIIVTKATKSGDSESVDGLIPPGPMDTIRVIPQYLYPKRIGSALMYLLTRIRFAPWKNWQIRWFIRRYGVDMSIAAEQDTRAFPDFNTFFTRALTPGARPLADDPCALLSPADGALFDYGEIRSGTLLQAKAHRYSVAGLLAESDQACARFAAGSYATVYLAPMDYHRVHLPLAGVLESMTYVPGALFSVNPITARGVPGLFARNERVVCHFSTEFGAMAVVMVGAVFVGGIETVWHGPVTPARNRRLTRWSYAGDEATQRRFDRGDEMGRFNMGSTVVIVLERGALAWAPALETGSRVNMGRALATFGANSQI